MAAITRCGAGIGAAAVAAGLTLTGPQAVGIAAAQTGDEGLAATGSDTSTAESSDGSRGGHRVARGSGAAVREHPAPEPAAAVAADDHDDDDGAQKPVSEPQPTPRQERLTRAVGAAGYGGAATGAAPAERADRSRRHGAAGGEQAAAPPKDPPAATGPTGSAPDGNPNPEFATADPPAQSADATGPGPAAAQPADSFPANPGPQTAPAVPVSAKPLAVLGAAVGNVIDSAVKWLSGQPANPMTEFLQGALLLVRRTLLGVIAAAAGGGHSGQTAAASPYLTDEELRAHLLALAQQQYGSLFGQTVPDYGYFGYKWLDGAPEGIPLRGNAPGAVSDTNTQVDGVDEADFVETDGRYLYVARNGTLTILDAESGETAQTTLSGHVVGQYLSGDRLTVISQSGGGWYGPTVRIAYGPWWDWNPQTTVTVFDVSDRAAPTVAGQTVYDGAYRDSRSVDGTVYLVLDRTLRPPEPLYTEVPATKTGTSEQTGLIAVDRPYPGPVTQRTYQTWDEYVARVGDQITSLSLPHAYAVGADGALIDLGVIADADQIVRPRSGDDSTLLTVVSVDSAAEGAGFASAAGSLVNSAGTTVYMTPGALYLGTTQDGYSDNGSSTSTRIERFLIDGTTVSWQAAGVVPGTLINQFAMDERDGYLRVAAYTWNSQWAGGTWATVNHSGVYVLDTAGETLDVVGSVTGLAPGEQLYAARFVGETAYLVTFLQTDPLFAINLSDPAHPVLEGELVIPGFSNYLQSVGEGLLVGIGQEREPGTWNTRLHVSLFDVTDGANLTQIERQFLDESAQWSWSQAQFDHHALLYSPDPAGTAGGILVVPVSASGPDPDTGEHRYRTSLHVLRVGEGIETMGVIRTDGIVERTVRIGDVLYAITDSHITTYRLTDLTEIGSIPIGQSPEQAGVPA